MNVAGIDTTKPRTQPYVEAIVSGCPGDKKIYDFDGIQLKTKMNFVQSFNPSDEIEDLMIYLSEA